MPSLLCDPPLPPTAAGSGPFVQSLRLMEGKIVIAAARWHSGTTTSQGVVQIIDLAVAPEHQRKGHGARILKECYRQATDFYKARKAKLRRAWIAVEQKRHVIARAFLTQQGFHHVGTVQELLRDEDLLIYSRTFD